MGQSGTPLALSIINNDSWFPKGFLGSNPSRGVFYFMVVLMNGMFQKEKSDFLNKKDKSKKGSIDKDIIPLIKLVNSNDDYYTTSSCAGRIVLLEMKSRKKNECRWIFTKHDRVKFNEINSALKKYSIQKNFNDGEFNNEKFNKNAPNKKYGLNEKSTNKIKDNNKTKNLEIWLKQQPLILHVACINLEAGKKLLEISRRLFKKAGIIGVTDRKVTVEIIGSEHLETIVKDKNFAVDEKYLKQLVKYANRNFAENRKKINKFLKLIEHIKK